MKGYSWWWLRRLICAAKGHVPDGVVRGGDENMHGSEMWCARRCGISFPPGTLTAGDADA